MPLTPENLDTLRRKFALNEHEVTRGYIYIQEWAVTTRIEEVDPSWSWVIINEWVRDNQAICIGRLTIGDTSRDGVGMQPLTIVSRGNTIEGTEPEKSAATDALKRAARLFGVGRYLLTLPENVKDMATLATWLNNGTQQGRRTDGKSQTTGGTAPATPKAVQTSTDAENAAIAMDGTIQWTSDFNALMAHHDIERAYPQENHRAAAINKLHQLNVFLPCVDVNSMAHRVLVYQAYRKAGKTQEKAIAEILATPEVTF